VNFFLTGTICRNEIAGAAASPLKLVHSLQPKIEAIAFDAFTIFDPGPVFSLVNRMFPDKGAELAEAWRSKQFEYSCLRATGGAYKDFWDVIEDALVFAARKTGVKLIASEKKLLMEQYLYLDVWPDVVPALEKLSREGIRLIFLSNMTTKMLRSCSSNAKIELYFEHIISSDRAKTYKPSPAAYQLGMDTLKLEKEEILFAAFAGWDASGAKWFGYPTFWVNRQVAPVEELGAMPDGIGKGLAELVSFVQQLLRAA
jgi:2-haloacid dehalogenase